MKEIKQLLSNKYIRNGLILLLIVYGTGIIPVLNQEVVNLFQYTLTKIIILVVVAYLMGIDQTLAILLGIVYMMTICRGNEGFIDLSGYWNFLTPNEKKYRKMSEEGVAKEGANEETEKKVDVNA